MSFFAELKRRNVVRVGIAYAVVTWIVLQLTDVLSDILVLPEWVPKLILLILIIGLLPALIFAWAFEMTPEGLKREKDVDRTQSITPQTGRKLDFAIIGLLALGLVYFIWESRFADRGSDPILSETSSQSVVEQSSEGKRSDPDGSDPDESDPDGSDPDIGRKSIAVLPFDNRSDQTSDKHFVEGVHDDLLTNLSRIGGLKVISRTSVNLYKDSEKSIPQIANELGVATIMEGAVQRSGNTVRINVQLIDAQTDEHLWAEIFDRELTAENLFAIQSEIAERIAGALETTLTDAERDRISTMPTDNLEAYDAYVRGRQLMATRETSDLEESTREFKRAVELDSEFALAWVGVADSHFLLREYGTFDRAEALAIREDAIETALALDENLGEAYVQLGQIHEDKREFEASEAAFLKGIELSPNYATAYHWYASLVGRYPMRAEEVVELAKKAAELDPRSSIIGNLLGIAYRDLGLYSRAERQLKKVLDLDPGFISALVNLASLYADYGRFDLAMKYARLASDQDSGNPIPLHLQAFYYLQLGEAEKAEELLARLEEMDSERIGNGFVSLWLNYARGNMAGAQESAKWLLPRMQEIGDPLYFYANLEAMLGNPVEAREFYLASEPGWIEPERWPALIEEHQENGCIFAWILMRTDDQELGDQLLAQTTRYMTEDLPSVFEHADNWGVDMCYLTAGDTEKAYTVLETMIDHNHLGFYREWTRMPMYEVIRHEQRFQDLLAEHDRLIAEQRELVRQMDEGMAL